MYGAHSQVGRRRVSLIGYYTLYSCLLIHPFFHSLEEDAIEEKVQELREKLLADIEKQAEIDSKK